MTQFEYDSNDDTRLHARYLGFQLWLIEKYGKLDVSAGWDIDATTDGMYSSLSVKEEFKQRFPTEDELLFVQTARSGNNQIWFIDKRVRKEIGSGHLKTQVFLTTRVYQVIVIIEDDLEAVEFRLAMS